MSNWSQLRAPEGAPNVLLVMGDDIGYGHMGAFGGPARPSLSHRCQDIYWRAIARLNRSSGVIKWSWLSSPMSSWTHSISPVKRLPVGP